MAKRKKGRVILVDVPLTIKLNKPFKKTQSNRNVYSLNLNIYRNLNGWINGAAKKKFSEIVRPRLADWSHIKMKKCKIEYTIFVASRRRCDLDNIGSIVSKFTNDCLVDSFILTDDSYRQICEITFKYGGVCQNNPHAKVRIEEILF